LPLNIQVHHKKRVVDIIREFNLQTFEDALNCSALWDIENGVVLTKGEHFIISCLERHKKISKGLLEFLEWFLIEKKKNAFIITNPEKPLIVSMA
jgi:hypothetical protein